MFKQSLTILAMGIMLTASAGVGLGSSSVNASGAVNASANPTVASDQTGASVQSGMVQAATGLSGALGL